jgi:trigger factor
MKITIAPSGPNQKELQVTLSEIEAKEFFEKAASQITRQRPIAGFRPGAAPFSVVAKKIGKPLVYQKTAQLAVESTLEAVLRGQKLKPLGQPLIKIKQIGAGKPLQYSAQIALEPQVKLPDLKKIKVSAEKVVVTEKQTEDTLKALQKKRASFVAVSRAAQPGDRVELDFEIQVGGITVEGGRQQNFPVKLGKDNLLPGLDKHIIGLKRGAEKTLDLKIPSLHPHRALAGKKARVKFQIKAVQEEQLPALNDAFAKELGNFSSLSQLKNSIQEGLTFEKEQQEKQRRRAVILEKLRTQTDFEPPALLVEQEAEALGQSHQQEVKELGISWEDYLAKIKATQEQLKKTWQDQAYKNVKNALILRQVVKEQAIKITSQEIELEINKILARFSSPQEAKEKINLPTLYNRIKAQLKNEKALEYLENALQS